MIDNKQKYSSVDLIVVAGLIFTVIGLIGLGVIWGVALHYNFESSVPIPDSDYVCRHALYINDALYCSSDDLIKVD